MSKRRCAHVPCAFLFFLGKRDGSILGVDVGRVNSSVEEVDEPEYYEFGINMLSPEKMT